MKYVNISDDESDFDLDLDKEYIFIDNHYPIPTDKNITFISKYINNESVNKITTNLKKTTSIIKTELFEIFQILKDISSFENNSRYSSSFLD